MENRIISVLIGLVGACRNNPKTENTDSLLIKALAFSGSSLNLDNSAIEKLIDEIRAEKNRIAPNCAYCASPCGNTSDYDMSRLYESENETGQLKIKILCELNEIAASILQRTLELEEAETELLYRGLSYVSYDMEAERLNVFLNELQRIKESKNDKKDHKN